jgi:catalase
VEQQFLINAIRFETSHIKSKTVKENVVGQLNKVSNDIAKRVAVALGLSAPAPDPTFYHNNKTAFITIFGNPLPTISTLQVGVLASTNSSSSIAQAESLKDSFGRGGVVVTVIGESLVSGIDETYSAADATSFDGIVVAAGAEGLFDPKTQSPLYPNGRPAQILIDGFRWGKPVGSVGSASAAFKFTGIDSTDGVYIAPDVDTLVDSLEKGLATFKFIDRFPLDS